MGLFDKMKEPVFLKESSNAAGQLEKLKALESKLNDKGRKKLRQEIRCVEYGIAGEKNIAFELRNSHMPMYILHDIYLEVGDLSAQIDYLVFTRKLCFVIECKNLMGNIEVNSRGDFIRTTEFSGRKKREGIYSPITQNQRHLDLMKKAKIERGTSAFKKFLVGRFFEDSYKPIVVLANPKTILNAKFAKKEIKEQIIRADQLVNYIRECCKKSKEVETSDEGLLAWAQSFLDLHIEKDKDYTSKFDEYLVDSEKIGGSGSAVLFAREKPKDYGSKGEFEEKTGGSGAAALSAQEKSKDHGGENGLKQQTDSDKIEDSKPDKKSITVKDENIEETEIYKKLRAYRLDKSREEKIKPYFIYNNKQLEELIFKMPITKDELITVSGFGDVKASKYGDDIINIIKKYK